MPPERTIIVGGGWAGISAAIHLTRNNQPVTLIEAADQLGGRARMVMFGDTPVDNGQHIALGAYRNLLELLKIIGLEESRVLKRLPLSLRMTGKQGIVNLSALRLPAPLHLLLAFLNARGVDTRDKLKTITSWMRLVSLDDDPDMTVARLLQRSGQPQVLSDYIWEPLCIAALNTSVAKASAKVFQRVLRDAFMRQRADSDLLFPRYDMGRTLPLPAGEWLRSKGVNIMKNTRVTGLVTDTGKITGVRLGEETLDARRVIFATNPWTTVSLCSKVNLLAPVCEKINQLDYEPIATVYLKYAKPVLLNPVMQGYVNSTIQWLFDRRITSHPKIVAAVISADGEHNRMDKNTLVRKVLDEIRHHTCLKEDPLNSMVIREKRATFSATPAAEKLRPGNRTALQGCWLAGDYTDTGYPATLEGAVISGKQCVQAMLQPAA